MTATKSSNVGGGEEAEEETKKTDKRPDERNRVILLSGPPGVGEFEFELFAGNECNVISALVCICVYTFVCVCVVDLFFLFCHSLPTPSSYIHSKYPYGICILF